MKAVITVTGKDKVGIIAMASAECAKYGVNIVDISQTVLDEYFAMIMLVELSGLTVDFTAFADSPNVYNAQDFYRELQNLPNKALQQSSRRV